MRSLSHLCIRVCGMRRSGSQIARRPDIYWRKSLRQREHPGALYLLGRTQAGINIKLGDCNCGQPGYATFTLRLPKFQPHFSFLLATDDSDRSLVCFGYECDGLNILDMTRCTSLSRLTVDQNVQSSVTTPVPCAFSLRTSPPSTRVPLFLTLR